MDLVLPTPAQHWMTELLFYFLRLKLGVGGRGPAIREFKDIDKSLFYKFLNYENN